MGFDCAKMMRVGFFITSDVVFEITVASVALLALLYKSGDMRITRQKWTSKLKYEGS